MLQGCNLITILLALFALGFGYIILSQANKEYKVEIKISGTIIGIIILVIALACLIYSITFSRPHKNRLLINERNIEKVPFRINVISSASTEATKGVTFEGKKITEPKKILSNYPRIKKYRQHKLWEKKH